MINKILNVILAISTYFVFFGPLALKLLGIVDWSWWIVTSPLWFPYVLLSFLLWLVIIIIGSLTICIAIGLGLKILFRDW